MPASSHSLPAEISAELTISDFPISTSMYYHGMIMVLFGLLKTPYRYPARPMIITPSEARETCIESALQIAQMIRLYRHKWSIEFISETAVYWVSIALFVLLDALDSRSNRQAFIELSSVLKLFSKHWFLAQGILRMVQITAKRMQIHLPAETQSLLDEFETKTWHQQRGRRRLSSAYPNYTLLFHRVTGIGSASNDPIDMDQFLEKLDDAKLEKLSNLESAPA